MAFGRGTSGDATHVGPAKKSTLATLLSLSPALLLSWIGWGIVTAGLSALQHRCLSDSSLAGQQIAPASVLGQYDPNPQCKSLYRYSWFIWALEFFVLAVFTIASFSFHLRRLSWLGPLIVVTVLIIDQTNRFISFRSLVTGSIHRAANVVFAGWLISAVGLLMLMLAYGWILDERYGAGYTGSGRDVESGMTGNVGAGANRKNTGVTGTTGAGTTGTGAHYHEGAAPIVSGPTPERY